MNVIRKTLRILSLKSDSVFVERAELGSALAYYCMITVLSTSLFDNDTIMQIKCDNSIFQTIMFIVVANANTLLSFSLSSAPVLHNVHR